MPSRMSADVLRFEEFLLDCRGRALYRSGKYVELRGKPLQLLIFLARRAGKLVPSETLLAKLWDLDNGVATKSRSRDSRNRLEEVVYRVRHAVEDNTEPHRIIATDYGNGYIFVPLASPALRSDLPHPTKRSNKGFRDELAQSFVVQPATVPDIQWAARLANRVYSGIDVIPESQMLEWYHQNSNGFSVVRSKLGDLVGNLDILPLRSNVLDEFVAGRLIELDFLQGCLHPPAELEEISNLYVESFVTVHGNSLRANPFAAAEILAEFSSIIRRICNSARLQKVYAIAASKAGRRLLSHIGFEICSKAEDRRDKHDLFSITGDDLIVSLQGLFGDGRRDPQTLRLFEDANSEEGGL
jgi:DNA-binding winged helix-turn-helix (wHTH) protein